MRNFVFMAAFVLSSLTAFGAETVDVRVAKILYPVVRVSAVGGVGSGVVIYSEDRDTKGSFDTFVVTNHHVVDNAIRVAKKWDNLTQSYVDEETNEQVNVEIFEWSKNKIVSSKTVKAEIISHKEEEDIAVLKLDYELQVPNVAVLLPAGAEVSLFQEVYAVGCSLGHDPLHSFGQITDLSYKIDNKEYTMCSAPIIFGNSGGAVFATLDDKHVFVGIPARVAVSDRGVVPHMAYFIPMKRIREFITTQKLMFLVDTAKTPAQAFEERKKMRKPMQGSKGGESGPGEYEPDHDHGG